MPYNGSGTFVRVHDWTQDADNAIGIVATRHDEEDDGFATGLSSAITKNGETTITANLPMAGFRHTGVGNASARTHYGVVGQLQDGSYIYATSGGSSNAYTLTLSPAITAYQAGQEFTFKANHDSTGAATLNVNSVGAIAIKKLLSTDIAADDIKNGQIIEVIYDGTNFQMINPSGTAAAGRATLGLGTAATQNTGTFLQVANNLSDVNNAATSFGNIKQAATDSATGVVELATSTEARSKSGGTALTCGSLSDIEYISSPQTITLGGTLTLSHGLGVVPRFLYVQLVNVTGEFGYSTNDIAELHHNTNDSGGQISGMAVKFTSSQLQMRYGTQLQVVNFNDGQAASITAANWQAIFIARV